MRKKVWHLLIVAAAMCIGLHTAAMAAFEPEVEAAYNKAVQGQDALDGLIVEVQEKTVSSRTNLFASKQVDLTVSGIRNDSFAADIQVSADEDTAQSYYRNGYYYETLSGQNIKSAMDRSTIWEQINSHIYLDMTSNYLKMLYSEAGENGGTVFYFAATSDTLGDYTEKLLDTYSAGQGTVIDSLQGSMNVDADGHVQSRSITMIYTTSGENGETFLKTANSVFTQGSDPVSIKLPNLSLYQEMQPSDPVITITPEQKTVYATTDINVRSGGDLNAAVIGGYSRANAITQTGYTSDGWIQVQYNGTTGYVWGEYVSNTRPVTTTEKSGIMYATVDSNIRSTYSTDGTILGVLKKGSPIEISGTTDNGWTRVRYEGKVGYISSNLLSDSEPLPDNYVYYATIEGIITEVGFNVVTVRSHSQGTMIFNTSYAALSLQDYMEAGDEVTIVYEGVSPYTAIVVIDDVNHIGNTNEDDLEQYTVDGVVTDYRPDYLELSCTDGIVRTFNLRNADINVDVLGVGSYVMVSWESYFPDEIDDIQALSVD
ncbi:MAG: SH3 domain-containing protein [Lachnospiraceae bacterium]|nr:SH3 domain-containing protein [Lachnospiraceae bacterium]